MSLVVDGPLTMDRLRSIAKFDEETGEFFSLVQRGKITPGCVLGRIRADGYITICIDRHTYLAHRLVRFYLTGAWPARDIDHWNGDPSNNRPWNLRDATRGQNLANAKRPSHNTSGFKGVARHLRARKWRAEITVDHKHIHLGLFGSASEAHAAYCEAAASFRGSFARTE